MKQKLTNGGTGEEGFDGSLFGSVSPLVPKDFQNALSWAKEFATIEDIQRVLRERCCGEGNDQTKVIESEMSSPARSPSHSRGSSVSPLTSPSSSSSSSSSMYCAVCKKKFSNQQTMKAHFSSSKHQKAVASQQHLSPAAQTYPKSSKHHASPSGSKTRSGTSTETGSRSPTKGQITADDPKVALRSCVQRCLSASKPIFEEAQDRPNWGVRSFYLNAQGDNHTKKKKKRPLMKRRKRESQTRKGGRDTGTADPG